MDIQSLKVSLGWGKISEEDRKIVFENEQEGEVFIVFKVCPSNPDWPSINLVFSSPNSFEQIEFGRWDDYLLGGREVGMKGVLAFTRDLIERHKILIEELDRSGGCRAAYIYELNSEPTHVSPDVCSFKYTLFDREPWIEPLDESRYVTSDSMRILRRSEDCESVLDEYDISIEDIKALLDWENVSKEKHGSQFKSINIHPENAEFAPLKLVFGKNGSFDHLELHGWEDYHLPESRIIDLAEAVVLSKELMKLEKCLVVSLDGEFHPLAADIGKPGEKPRRLDRKARALKYFCFGREPEVVLL